MRIFLLDHFDRESRIGQEDQLSLFITSQVLLFYAEEVEIIRVFGVFRFFDPTSLENREILITTLGPIFVFQAVLDHLILERSYGTNDLSSVEVQGKELCDPLIHKLVNSFLQLFGLERIGIVDISEMLRREAWNTLEMQHFPLGKGVPNLEIAGIV